MKGARGRNGSIAVRDRGYRIVLWSECRDSQPGQQTSSSLENRKHGGQNPGEVKEPVAFFSKGVSVKKVEEEKIPNGQAGAGRDKNTTKGDGDAIEVAETQQHRNRMSPKPEVQVAEVRRTGMNAGYSGRT